MTVQHLYTTKDVQAVREKLLHEQGGLDLVTKLLIPPKQSVLDHDHKTQYVRGVLHRQTNAVLGKLENAYIRYISWWYEGTLSDFLRGCADYLDREQPQNYIHPAFVKFLQVQFNKLSEPQKKKVLAHFGSDEGTNGKQRKALFQKVILRKENTMQEFLEVINKEKDSE